MFIFYPSLLPFKVFVFSYASQVFSHGPSGPGVFLQKSGYSIALRDYETPDSPSPQPPPQYQSPSESFSHPGGRCGLYNCPGQDAPFSWPWIITDEKLQIDYRLEEFLRSVL